MAYNVKKSKKKKDRRQDVQPILIPIQDGIAIQRYQAQVAIQRRYGGYNGDYEWTDIITAKNVQLGNEIYQTVNLGTEERSHQSDQNPSYSTYIPTSNTDEKSASELVNQSTNPTYSTYNRKGRKNQTIWKSGFDEVGAGAFDATKRESKRYKKKETKILAKQSELCANSKEEENTTNVVVFRAGFDHVVEGDDDQAESYTPDIQTDGIKDDKADILQSLELMTVEGKQDINRNRELTKNAVTLDKTMGECREDGGCIAEDRQTSKMIQKGETACAEHIRSDLDIKEETDKMNIHVDVVKSVKGVYLERINVGRPSFVSRACFNPDDESRSDNSTIHENKRNMLKENITHNVPSPVKIEKNIECKELLRAGFTEKDGIQGYSGVQPDSETDGCEEQTKSVVGSKNPYDTSVKESCMEDFSHGEHVSLSKEKQSMLNDRRQETTPLDKRAFSSGDTSSHNAVDEHVTAKKPAIGIVGITIQKINTGRTVYLSGSLDGKRSSRYICNPYPSSLKIKARAHIPGHSRNHEERILTCQESDIQLTIEKSEGAVLSECILPQTYTNAPLQNKVHFSICGSKWMDIRDRMYLEKQQSLQKGKEMHCRPPYSTTTRNTQRSKRRRSAKDSSTEDRNHKLKMNEGDAMKCTNTIRTTVGIHTASPINILGPSMTPSIFPTVDSTQNVARWNTRHVTQSTETNNRTNRLNNNTNSYRDLLFASCNENEHRGANQGDNKHYRPMTSSSDFTEDIQLFSENNPFYQDLLRHLEILRGQRGHNKRNQTFIMQDSESNFKDSKKFSKVGELLGKGGISNVHKVEITTGSSENEKAYFAEKEISIDRVRVTDIWIPLFLRPLSPLIMPVYRAEIDNKCARLYMPIAEGGSLAGILHEGQTKIESKMVVFHSIMLTVDFLHDHNIIHGDIKPENVLFLRKNDLSSIVLSDFGTVVVGDNERGPFFQETTKDKPTKSAHNETSST